MSIVNKLINKICLFYKKHFLYFLIKRFDFSKICKINLCGGNSFIPGYLNIDIDNRADLVFDLNKYTLPFKDNSIDIVICISAINYFPKDRANTIINEVFRVLKSGGIARFGTQDLEIIAEKYISKDKNFWDQLDNGKIRFTGETYCDKFNSWFYGYSSNGNCCKYVYDFETLSLIFKKSGFSKIENKKYQESSIDQIKLIDNRKDQMFFLEAIK